jgi:hypothetical protein
MIEFILEKRDRTAMDVFRNEKVNHNNVSVTVIKRMFKEEGLTAHKPKKVIEISAKNKEKRIEFALDHRKWRTNEWSNVVFTDESLICASKFQIRWIR